MYFHLFGTEYCNPLLLVGFPGRSGRFIKPFYFTVLFVTKSPDCCMCIVSLPMDQLSQLNMEIPDNGCLCRRASSQVSLCLWRWIFNP